MQYFLSATLAALLFSTPALADLNLDCDRTGDAKVTISDALSALKVAVEDCDQSEQCDSTGDGQVTVADALALLRFSVELPVELHCECSYIDECFGHDQDCVDAGFPENYHCVGDGYTCGECGRDEDCADGQICDPCKWECR